MAALIVYFSRAGNNYVNGSIKDLTVGNTEVAAGMIRELTGGKVFRIEPVTAYSDDYSECIEEAKQDLKRNARPELKAYPESLEPYDTIYLGYPNYWGTMPAVVFTFLEKYDFADKMIRPFCTHEGSGMGDSERDIKQVCRNGNLMKGLAIHGARGGEAKAAIRLWIDQQQ